MSAFVDTKILARHLTGDRANIAPRATAYLEAAPELLVNNSWSPRRGRRSVFCEAPRRDVAGAVLRFGSGSLASADRALLLPAVWIHESERVDSLRRIASPVPKSPVPTRLLVSTDLSTGSERSGGSSRRASLGAGRRRRAQVLYCETEASATMAPARRKRWTHSGNALGPFLIS
ncbi:MAG: hypothetical protein ACYCSF_14110 [Acidimicrobiales bacterium]